MDRIDVGDQGTDPSFHLHWRVTLGALVGHFVLPARGGAKTVISDGGQSVAAGRSRVPQGEVTNRVPADTDRANPNDLCRIQSTTDRRTVVDELRNLVPRGT